MRKSPLENHKPKGVSGGGRLHTTTVGENRWKIDYKRNVPAHFKRVQNCGCVARWLPQISIRTLRLRVA